MYEIDTPLMKEAHMNKTTDVKFGTLYTAPVRDLRAWASRIDSNNCMNQCYGQFLPFCDEGTGKIYMIDTYHITEHGMKNGSYQHILDDAAERGRSASSWFINACRTHCYYNDCVELCDANAHLFEEQAYLPDWRIARNEECRDYADEDVIFGVKLWWECAYPGGLNLIRKNAKPNLDKQVEAIVRDIYRDNPTPSYWGYPVNKLNDFLAELPEDAEYDKDAVAKAREYAAKLEAIEADWRKFYRELNEKYKHDEEEETDE